MKAKWCLLAAGLALSFAMPAAAQTEYVVGVSGALTGPAASSYAPTVEALRVYIDLLNKKGGIGGKTVKLIALDDQGQPSRGSSNARRLITQDQVSLLIGSGLSATSAPMIAEAQQSGTPLLFAGSVCPQEVFPPAKEGIFCTTAFAAELDSRAAVEFIEKRAGTKIKLGLAAMAIPISRTGIDFAEKLAEQKGMKPVSKQIIPPPTPDYTPFATKIREADPDWVFSWAPWITQVKTFEALRQLGWKGPFLTWAHLEAENELARIKDPKFIVYGANTLFTENLPVQQEIATAVKGANVQYPVNQMAEGWIAGMTVEAALKAAGKNDPRAINTAMQNLKIDTKGLRGGPIEWTATNHFRTKQYYRFYEWNAAKQRPDKLTDWVAYTVE